MTYQITLDKEHKYEVDGVRRPGFTEIAKDMGVIKDNPFYTAHGRDEGTALSEWNLFLAGGGEPEYEPDACIAGRVKGFRKFLKDTAFTLEGGEGLLFSKLNYCCKPDLWGRIGTSKVLVEAKRGAKLKWHRLQTAAQAIALRENGFAVQKRLGLYLSDGGYSLELHDDKQDEERWRALVMAYHAKRFYE